ncbi:MAG: hypothetical protein IIB56_03990 [Planctomycetes bacterium]|nr:hypothetical protein [Planctomycetota bacterium]
MQIAAKQYIKCRRAFTLVELILVVGTIGMVTGALVGVIGNSTRDYEFGSDRSTLFQDGQAVLDQMVRTLRQAKAFAAVSPSTDQAGYITYTSVDDVSEQFKLNTQTGELEYGQPASLSALTGNVSSLTFTCYDTDAVALTGAVEPNDIKSVQIEITLTGTQNTVTLTGRVYCPKDITSVYVWTPDSSGNEHHVEVNADFSQRDPNIKCNLTVAQGQVNNAFDFSEGWLELPPIINRGLTSYTFTCWVLLYKRDGTTYIIFQQLGPKGRSVMYRGKSTNKLYTWLNKHRLETSEAVFDATDQWYHIALVVDIVNKTGIWYVDGKKVKTKSNAGSNKYSTGGFHLGAHKFRAPQWNGRIDDVRMYDVVLSQSDIKDVMAGGEVGSPLGWWKLDVIIRDSTILE